MDKKTLVIDKDVHKKLKEHCNKKNLKINELANDLLADYLEFINKDSNLPLIMKNSKGDVIELVYCSSISTNYINNMPKELTLVRKAKDEGYVANYVQK